MAHYSGINLGVFWGTAPKGSVELAVHGRSVDVTETAPAPDTIDVTHKGDTAKQIIEGLPGAAETNVSFTALVEDSWILCNTMPLNTIATLYVFPRGKTDTYPMITVGAARLHERTYKEPYDGAVEMTLTFNSKAVATHSTYASSGA